MRSGNRGSSRYSSTSESRTLASAMTASTSSTLGQIPRTSMEMRVSMATRSDSGTVGNVISSTRENPQANMRNTIAWLVLPVTQYREVVARCTDRLPAGIDLPAAVTCAGGRSPQAIGLSPKTDIVDDVEPVTVCEPHDPPGRLLGMRPVALGHPWSTPRGRRYPTHGV